MFFCWMRNLKCLVIQEYLVIQANVPRMRARTRRSKAASSVPSPTIVELLEARRLLTLPMGTSTAVIIPENTSYTIQTADFGFTEQGGSFAGVNIASLPGQGTLADSNPNTIVAANSIIPIADISAGDLTFTPVTGTFGTPYSSINFRVEDGSGNYDDSAKTLSFDVAQVNQPPVISETTSSFSTVNNAPVTITGLSVSDPDSDGQPETMTLTVEGGNLQLTTDQGGVTSSEVTGNGSNMVTIVATLDQINTTLGTGGLSYTPAPQTIGADSLSIIIDDDGNTGAGGTLKDTDTIDLRTARTPTYTIGGGGVYTGNPQTASATAFAIDGKTTVNGTWSFVYSDMNGPLPAAPTDGGNYTVVGTFTSTDSEYTGVTTAATPFNITKASLKFVANASSGTFNGNTPPFSADATGVNNVAIKLNNGNLSFEFYANGVVGPGLGTGIPPTDVGSYALVASYLGSQNYEAVDSQPVFFNITAATPTYAISGGGVFTGKPQVASATAFGIDGVTPVNGKWTFAYSDAKGPLPGAPTNVGNYTVIGTFTSTDMNYEGVTTDSTPLKITPDKSKVMATEPNGIANPIPVTATASATGINGVTVSGTTTFTYYSGPDANGAVVPAPSTVAGTYTVVASFVSDDPNYGNASSEPVTFTVSAASPTKIVVVGLVASSATAGVAIPDIELELQDAYGNLVTNDLSAVKLNLSSGAHFSQTYSVENFSNGMAIFKGVTFNTSGVFDLSASDQVDSLTTGRFGIVTVVPSTASQLVFTPAIPTTFAHGYLTITVAVEDSYGNLIANDSARPVTLTVNGKVYTATTSGGIATFKIQFAKGMYALAANSNGLSSTPTVDVTAT